MAIDLGIIQQGMDRVNALPGQMRALPAEHAQMRQEVAHAQKDERKIAGYQALNDATKKHTIVNEDGTKTVNYAALAPELAAQGFPDIAAQVTDAYLKSSGSALEFQNKANQSFAGYLNALPPERREEGARRAIPSYRNHFGANIDPLNYFDEDGTFNHDKANAFIEANRLGTLPAADQASIRQTEQQTRLESGGYGLGQGSDDPNSEISKQAQAAGRAARLDPSYVAGKSALTLSKDPKYTTAIANAQTIEHQTELSQVPTQAVTQEKLTEAQQANEDLQLVMSTMQIIREMGTEDPGILTATLKKISPRTYAQVLRKDKMLAAIGALENLDAKLGFKGDVNDTPQALLSNLQSVASRLQLKIQQSGQRAPSGTAPGQSQQSPNQEAPVNQQQAPTPNTNAPKEYVPPTKNFRPLG